MRQVDCNTDSLIRLPFLLLNLLFLLSILQQQELVKTNDGDLEALRLFVVKDGPRAHMKGAPGEQQPLQHVHLCFL